VEAALDAGCTLIDTADVYGYSHGSGFGVCETLLGEVLREAPQLRSRMVLATKAGITPPVPYDSSAEYLVEACEASLRRLGVEYVDLFQIHRPDLLAHPAEVSQALERLRRTGKILEAGVSNYSAAQFDALAAHLPFALASVQNELSPLAIEGLSDGTLDAAMRRRGTAVIAWSPLGQARLGAQHGALADSARTDRVIAALDVIARRDGTPRTAVAYAWVMAHPARPIPLMLRGRSAAVTASTAVLTGATTAMTRYHRRLSSAPAEDRFRRAIRKPSVRASATISVVCGPVDHMPKRPEEPITHDLSATFEAA